MNLTPIQKQTIERVVNAFETGKADGDYGAVTILRDGPHDIPQITYGRSQTTEYGQLRLLIQRYVKANGRHSEALSRYADDIGTRPLAGDRTFRDLLRTAGKDRIMRDVQDRFFTERYYAPAMRWATGHGFKLPLSAPAIYDSFIHSGSMLWVIRGTFAEVVPAGGGDERAWIVAYLKARHRFLETHPRDIVRRTTYRMRCLTGEVVRGNWELEMFPIGEWGEGGVVPWISWLTNSAEGGK